MPESYFKTTQAHKWVEEYKANVDRAKRCEMSRPQLDLIGVRTDDGDARVLVSDTGDLIINLGSKSARLDFDETERLLNFLSQYYRVSKSLTLSEVVRPLRVMADDYHARFVSQPSPVNNRSDVEHIEREARDAIREIVETFE